MRILGEPAFQVAADFSGRGVRSYQIRILILQLSEFIHEVIVIIITHGRSILHIIFFAVLPENFSEFFYPFPSLFFVHCK